MIQITLWALFDPFRPLSKKAQPFNNTHHPQREKLISCQKGLDATLISTTTQFLVRRGQICSIAKEDPLGIVHLVQPEGSYFWDGTKMCPLSQEIYLKLFQVHLINKRLRLRLMTAEVYIKGHRVLVTALLKKLVTELI